MCRGMGAFLHFTHDFWRDPLFGAPAADRDRPMIRGRLLPLATRSGGEGRPLPQAQARPTEISPSLTSSPLACSPELAAGTPEPQSGSAALARLCLFFLMIGSRGWPSLVGIILPSAALPGSAHRSEL